jgi:hypothetical protein
MKTAFMIICLLLFPLSASADADKPHFTKHYKGSMFKITDKSLYSVELVIKDDTLKVGANSVNLIIHDNKDRDVVGAEITITPWMPSMGHGVKDVPVVTEKGGGLYSVENVVLSMRGHWELRINIKKSGSEDRAVFSFAGVGTGKTQKMHEHSPADMDTATTRMSAKKIFKVTYESRLDPLVVNKLHSVKLKVEAADGKPVKGAVIEIDGDMPAHGHGLPTEPEVTEELGNGYYLVEGMKFSMPGHWVIKVEIEAGEHEDTVVFNLNLK